MYFAVNFDLNFGLKAKKVASSQCVEVNWYKAESGACNVKYTVALKNPLGDDLYSITGSNIDEVKICDLPTLTSVTDVQLTATFKTISKSVTAKVSSSPANIPASRETVM